MISAALFGLITASGSHYPWLFDVAAGLAIGGAAILFTAHRLIGTRTATA